MKKYEFKPKAQKILQVRVFSFEEKEIPNYRNLWERIVLWWKGLPQKGLYSTLTGQIDFDYFRVKDIVRIGPFTGMVFAIDKGLGTKRVLFCQAENVYDKPLQIREGDLLDILHLGSAAQLKETAL